MRLLNSSLDWLNRWLARINRALEAQQIRKAREIERRLNDFSNKGHVAIHPAKEPRERAKPRPPRPDLDTR